MDGTVTNNILRAAESYADIFCMGARRMKFFATTVPQGIAGMDLPENKKGAEDDPNLIYAAELERGAGKKWKIVSDKTQNLAKLRENARRAEDAREHQLMMADFNELTKTDFAGRLAYMIGADRIDNLFAMATAARVTGKPVRVNLLANVAASGLDKARAEWPSAFLITQTSGLLNRAGWHVLSGSLRPMTEAEARENNATSPFDKAVLELSSAAACEQEACGEAADPIGLVRKRFEKPNWQPYHAPYGQGGTP